MSIKQSEKIIKLQELLSGIQVMYANVRSLHWNIKGIRFFELHARFEELYNDLQLKTDEVAERILALGEIPEHRMAKYIKLSPIAETQVVNEAVASVELIISNLKSLLPLEKSILVISGEDQDEGTSALMSDYIRAHEKMLWMWNSSK